MTNAIKEKALTKRGQFATVAYSRVCKVLKNAPIILKATKAYNVRIGASYDALKTVKEGRVDGTLPAENQGLNGLKWVQYPVVLKSVKSGAEMIRLETAKNTRFETHYFIAGQGDKLQEVSKKDIECYLRSSEKSKGTLPAVMNIKLDYITGLE